MRMHPECWFKYLLAVVACSCVAAGAAAQTVTPFQTVGHIEEFALNNAADPFSAARMRVNGIDIVIPRFTVVLMPAAYLTPQQIFRGPTQTGAALKDSGLALRENLPLGPAGSFTPPLAAFEAALDGNIVNGQYIAGLVHISQQSLNMAAGFIRSIDRNTGEICLGALQTPVATCAPPDVRVRINDPLGRYGVSRPLPAVAPVERTDLRFSVDPDNPTIHALTGYPMCVPRKGPGDDAECPAANRPAGLTTFVMATNPITSGLPPGHPPIPPCAACNPEKQAPFVAGDYLNVQGTLASFDGATIAAADKMYLSAHTIVANVGIYTAPGAKVVYVSQEKSLLGTFGAPISECAASIECQARVKIEGFITDPTRAPKVNVYAVDRALDGTISDRLLAIVQKAQAPFGRFRFILGRGTVGALLPQGKGATRELKVRVDDPNVHPEQLVANGLKPGQYVAPVAEYIFPEAVYLGFPQPPLNFRCLAFLTAGWSVDGIPPNIHQLSPWPGLVAPPEDPASIDCTQL